jgi:hypothetical protein
VFHGGKCSKIRARKVSRWLVNTFANYRQKSLPQHRIINIATTVKFWVMSEKSMSVFKQLVIYRRESNDGNTHRDVVVEIYAML